MSVGFPINGDKLHEERFKTVIWLVALPTFTMIAGGLLVFFYQLGPKLIAGMQHFASGILFAAVAWELAPTIVAESTLEKCSIIAGFLAGVIFLMFLGRYDFKHWFRCHGGCQGPVEATPFFVREEEEIGDLEADEQQNGEINLRTSNAPWGLIIAVAIDGFQDGLLIGISYVGSSAAGIVTSVALSIEMCLLGISTSVTLNNKTFLSKSKIALFVLILPLSIMLAGVLGATVLSGLTGAALIGVMSFGCAGLLYLVTEELMIAAHENMENDRWYVSVLFFMGFLFVVTLSEFT